MNLLLFSILLFGQVDDCPADDYLAKFMQCADPRICSARPPELPEKETELVDTWGESCSAYALMPSDWDHKTPARGLFLVGRLFPSYAHGWQGDDGVRYGARQALDEGELGHSVLAITGESDLWGCGEKKLVVLDSKALEAVGLCIDLTGALVGNPWWQLPRTGLSVATHSLLRRCDGTQRSIFNGLESNALGLSEEEWQETGVIATQVIERLGEMREYELLCVTEELAENRRKGRSVSP